MKQLLLVAFMLALFLDCTTTSEPHRFNADELSAINVAVHDVFFIELRGNATTGFVWRQIWDEAMSPLLNGFVAEGYYETEKSKRELCGAPGVFSFLYI